MAAPNGKKLTAKQRIFVKEYLVDLNATQAAIRAGYSPKTAAEQGVRLLRNIKVQEAIQAAIQMREARVDFSADSTLRELKNIVHFNIKSIFNEDGSLKKLHELDDDTAAAVNSVKFTSKMDGDDVLKVTEIKIHDKNKAIDSAMRHFGLFNDKLSVGVSINDVLAAFPDAIKEKIKEAIAKKING